MIAKHIGADGHVRRTFDDVSNIHVASATVINVRRKLAYVNTGAGYAVDERPNTPALRFYDSEKTVALINLAPGESLETEDEPARS